MPVTLTPRLSVTQWSDPSDLFTRLQMDAAFASLENLTAIDKQVTNFSDLGSPGVRGRYGWVTSTSALYRDDGTTWQPLRVLGLIGDVTTLTFGESPVLGASGRLSDAAHAHGMPAAEMPPHLSASDPHPQYALDTDVAPAEQLVTRYTRHFMLGGM